MIRPNNAQPAITTITLTDVNALKINAADKVFYVSLRRLSIVV